MKTSDFFQSHTFKIVLISIVGLVLLLAGFSIGEHIGFRKASFAFHGGVMQAENFSDAHGTVGKVLTVTLPAVTIADRDGTEKTILIGPQTIIRRMRDTLASTDIQAGDYIVAIGDPNAQSQIAARFIRELPPPSVSTTPQASQ
jgi:hypothetical protein